MKIQIDLRLATDDNLDDAGYDVAQDMVAPVHDLGTLEPDHKPDFDTDQRVIEITDWLEQQIRFALEDQKQEIMPDQDDHDFVRARISHAEMLILDSNDERIDGGQVVISVNMERED